MSTDLDQTAAALEIAAASLDELREWQQEGKVHQLPPALIDTLHRHCAALDQLFRVFEAGPPEGTAVVGLGGGVEAVQDMCPPEGVPCLPEELEGATLLSLPHEVMTRLYMLLPVRSCCSLAAAHPQFRDDLNSRADQIYTAHIHTDFGIDEDVVQSTAIGARAFYCACATRAPQQICLGHGSAMSMALRARWDTLSRLHTIEHATVKGSRSKGMGYSLRREVFLRYHTHCLARCIEMSV
jgi:hypothetical protein